MNTDKALANFKFRWNLRGGDTGRGRVEHRSFEQLRSALKLLKTGYIVIHAMIRFENNKSCMHKVDFVAYGHKNVIGKHKTTVEITSEKTLTLQGACIIGVKMGQTLYDLSDDIKKMVRSERTRIHLKMKVNDKSEEIVGYGSPGLTYESSISMVARTSPYECERTLMVKADKAASDLNRQFIAELSKPEIQIDCELIFVNEELHR